MEVLHGVALFVSTISIEAEDVAQVRSSMSSCTCNTQSRLVELQTMFTDDPAITFEVLTPAIVTVCLQHQQRSTGIAWIKKGEAELELVSDGKTRGTRSQ